MTPPPAADRPHVRWGLALIALLSLVALAAGTAHAQPTDATLRADELFDQGLDHKRAGNLDAACAAFAASQSLEPALGTQLNLAACLERDGKIAEARALLRDTAAQADTRGDLARASRARTDLAALDARHPAPKPVPATVTATETEPGSETATGTGTETETGTEAVANFAPAPSRFPARLPLYLGASAVALTVAGVVTARSAHGLQSQADDACPDPTVRANCDRERAQSLNDSAVTRSRIGIGLVVTGAAVGAAATYLWYRGRQDTRPQPGLALAPGGGAMFTLAGVLP